MSTDNFMPNDLIWLAKRSDSAWFKCGDSRSQLLSGFCNGDIQTQKSICQISGNVTIKIEEARTHLPQVIRLTRLRNMGLVIINPLACYMRLWSPKLVKQLFSL